MSQVTNTPLNHFSAPFHKPVVGLCLFHFVLVLLLMTSPGATRSTVPGELKDLGGKCCGAALRQ